MSPRKVIIAALCALSAYAFVAPVQAQTKDPLEEDFELRSASGFAHVPGFRYEYGLGSTTGVHTIGAGYMFAWESYSTFWIYSLLTRVGIGPDVKMVTESFDNVGGVLAYASTRLHIIGDSGGVGLEVAAGAGFEERGALEAGLVGVYYASDYFEIGYAYQFPVISERPDWLAQHLISVRIHIPLLRTAQPKLENEKQKAE